MVSYGGRGNTSALKDAPALDVARVAELAVRSCRSQAVAFAVRVEGYLPAPAAEDRFPLERQCARDLGDIECGLV